MSLTKTQNRVAAATFGAFLAVSPMSATFADSASNDDTQYEKCMAPAVTYAINKGDTNFQGSSYKSDDAQCSSEGFEKVGIYLSKAPDSKKHSARKIFRATDKVMNVEHEIGDKIGIHGTVNTKSTGITTVTFFVDGQPVIFPINGRDTARVPLRDLQSSALFVADLQRAGLQMIASNQLPSDTAGVTLASADTTAPTEASRLIASVSTLNRN